jgi:Rod binding domain-containing protein
MISMDTPQLSTQLHGYDKQLEAVRRANREMERAAPGREAKDPKLYKACVEFESLFVKQMLNAMRKTVTKGDLLHGGYAEDIFEDLLYDEYSMLMAKTQGFGVADMVYRQLTPGESGIISH